MATVAGTYTHAFVEADGLPREPAADAIDSARDALGVRQLYVDPGVSPLDEAGPASTLEADARTRTADPFHYE